MGKMSLISSINMKTCHQETMTIKTGEEDGDQEETFAVNYSDVRNVRLVLVANLAVGSFNPTNMQIWVRSLSGLAQYRISLI